MELKVATFKSLYDFNDYQNIELINNHIRVIPVTVIPHKGDELEIFYYLEELEIE